MRVASQLCARRSRPSSSSTSKAHKNTSGEPFRLNTAHVGRDKDSEARQRAAIESYAKAAGCGGRRPAGTILSGANNLSLEHHRPPGQQPRFGGAGSPAEPSALQVYRQPE
jgi:hypothetical protein